MFIFVADLFAEDFLGGAELTSEAILNKATDKVIKVRSSDLTLDFVKSHEDAKWIFGNFLGINRIIPEYFLHKNLNYSIIEYDYKYCDIRMPEACKQHRGECCENKPIGQLIKRFFLGAKDIWYMSKQQKDWYESVFPELAKDNSYVLSSIFDDATLDKICKLDTTNKDDVFLIQDHQHPLKGTSVAISVAKDNNLKYRKFSNLSHDQLLELFAKSKGLIFVPTQFDTCPRVTIEAKMLDCALILSNKVQHANEDWFNGSKEDIINYMKERLDFFWTTVSK
tara:strand:- start:66131 stop:66973 length:843 start_codon:yes stop_codon:yes gene_type:complete